MGRLATLLFGVAAYALFLGTFLLAIHFVGNLGLIEEGFAIDGEGDEPGGAQAFLIDAALLAVFAVQHSVMARPGFKRWWTQRVPQALERSVFVLLSSVALLLLFALWRPMPATVWDVSGTLAGTVLQVLFWAGWGIVLVSTFLIDHFELFGLKQVWQHFQGAAPLVQRFRQPGLYRFLRHPIMLGFLIAFWSAPRMTVGHLVFALATSAYILIAIQLEERDLMAHHGEAYRDYRARVPMLLPLPRSRTR
jgi:protein-S-isoprenylcysteine O-methyltransferase Ste14